MWMKILDSLVNGGQEQTPECVSLNQILKEGWLIISL